MKSKTSITQSPPSCRLDTWLWASRFFKSRKLATEAIKAGHISLNGQKAKPGKGLKIRDQLTIRKHQLQYHIDIIALSEKRLSAPLAQALYFESEEGKFNREIQLNAQKELRSGLSFDRNKPNKRDRSSMLKVKYQHPDD
ncbi:MAG: RNA-binding protein [Gammaproteobacteria bacterium]|nr:RNA-binding protein [Gammaproteobacteria bacterium]